MEKDTRPLFQITEAAHACGLFPAVRSCVWRKRVCWLPAYIAPDSGRRYYDNHNVARVLQIEKLKAMGLGTEEIAGYFASGGEVTELLSMLEERLGSFPGRGGAAPAGWGESGGLSIQLMTLPAVTCCTRRCEGAHHRGEVQRHVRLLRPVRPSGAADFPTSRCSPSRSGRTIWRAALATRRTPFMCACRCGLKTPPQGGGDAAGMPRPVGALLRRLQRRG